MSKAPKKAGRILAKERAEDRTDRAREAFLSTLRETCNVSEAARAAGIGRRTAYDWREADKDFAAQWVEAAEEAADRLEREAWRRAVEGVDKPVIFQGRITDTYKEYSDRMLEILLKGHRPEKYVEKRHLDVTSGGQSLVSQSQRDAAVAAATRADE